MSQAGIPPARTQADLTPLQRKALLDALEYQHEETERQYERLRRNR